MNNTAHPKDKIVMIGSSIAMAALLVMSSLGWLA
jgi:hypothetical protein